MKPIPFDDAAAVLERLKSVAIDCKGYRVDVSADGREERLIRPDGTVAVIARRTKDAK